MNQTTISAPAGSSERLPLGGLLALAMAAFITLLTEIMPAGVLSSIAGDLNVSESLAGQFITAYAVGALVAAIPFTALTQGMRRRLLLSAICGFAIVNLVTALSHDYLVSLATRFFAGVFGGIVWSLLAGYAVRMSPAHLGGRAIAISGAGATLALVLGVPLGTLLGRAIGWQGAFGLMTLMALMLVVWIIAIVPDFPGQAKEHRPSLSGVFLQCGIRAVLFVVFTFIVAHNILYIYLEPFLTPSGLSERVDIVLFIFGLGAIAGLGVAGMLVDRRVQSLTVMSIVIFALAAMLLGSGEDGSDGLSRGRIVGRGFRRFRHPHADGIVTPFRPRGRRGAVYVYDGLEYRRGRRWRGRWHAARQGRGGLFRLGHHWAPHPVFNRHAVCHESGAGLSAMK